MPVETTKEAAKVVVETSGSFGGIWAWLFGSVGAGVTGVWVHVTGRLKKIESSMVTAKLLKEHIDDENGKFRELFTKHDGIIDKVSAIASSVARIEGKLDK